MIAVLYCCKKLLLKVNKNIYLLLLKLAVVIVVFKDSKYIFIYFRKKICDYL